MFCRFRRHFYSSSFNRFPYFFGRSSKSDSSSLAPKIFVGSTLALFIYYQYKNYNQNLPPGVTPCRRAFYSIIPTNILTKTFGYLADIKLPGILRVPIIGSFAKLTGCDIDEAEKSIKEYASIGEFFARRLKQGTRSIESGLLISPVDARVVNFGYIERATKDSSTDDINKNPIMLEQVKGVSYSLSHFLQTQSEANAQMLIPKDKPLYYATLYLSPSNYHRFHSPTTWRIKESIPVAGECLPISTWMMRISPDLVSLNTRHILKGTWAHGFFSMVPVGATNVGTIVVDKQENERCYPGEEIGHFRMGSSIVLVFSAPKDFEWTVKVGDKIRVGQSIGKLPRKTSWFWSFS